MRTHVTLSSLIGVTRAAGCVSISEEARRIFVYQGNSAQVANCKQIGPASGSTIGSAPAGYQQAEHNLREDLVERYRSRADTVVITSSAVVGFGRIES